MNRLTDADFDGVVDVRESGLMLAVEFETKTLREDGIDTALKRKLLTLGCGHKTLRFSPRWI